MPEKSRQRQTAERLLTAFSSMDVETIMALRTPNCMRTIFPTSQGYSKQDNAQVGALLERLNGVFRNFSLELLDLTEDLPQRKVVMFLRARGDSDAGEYINEYVWRLVFDESGEKVEDWWEFTDASMKPFFPKLQEAMQARERETKGNVEQ